MVTLDQAGWGRTAVVILPPPPELGDLVEFLWIDAREHSVSRSSHWRIVPDDAPHIIYARSIDRSGRSEGHRLSVIGARRTHEDIDCSTRLLTAGARLKPGAAPALFRISARELTDRSTSAESLVGSTACEALASFENDPATHAASRLIAFIAALRRRGRRLDDRARWFSGTNRLPNTIHNVASRVGVTERALHAWAMTHLGMGVKRFASIRRLHNALSVRLADRSATWSRIAALSGYADQPHLVRECRALLGESPGDFVARSG